MKIVNPTASTTVIIFSRPQVQLADLSRFMAVCDPLLMSEGETLGEMMGTMGFEVDGYMGDTRELYSIPEVRKFYREFHRVWPYWFYFCDLHRDDLRIMTLCCLESTEVASGPARPGEAAVSYDPMEMLSWVSRNFYPMNQCGDRARLPGKAMIQRTDAIFRYFALPVPN